MSDQVDLQNEATSDSFSDLEKLNNTWFWKEDRKHHWKKGAIKIPIRV